MKEFKSQQTKILPQLLAPFISILRHENKKAVDKLAERASLRAVLFMAIATLKFYGTWLDASGKDEKEKRAELIKTNNHLVNIVKKAYDNKDQKHTYYHYLILYLKNILLEKCYSGKGKISHKLENSKDFISEVVLPWLSIALMREERKELAQHEQEKELAQHAQEKELAQQEQKGEQKYDEEIGRKQCLRLYSQPVVIGQGNSVTLTDYRVIAIGSRLKEILRLVVNKDKNRLWFKNLSPFTQQYLMTVSECLWGIYKKLTGSNEHNIDDAFTKLRNKCLELIKNNAKGDSTLTPDETEKLLFAGMGINSILQRIMPGPANFRSTYIDGIDDQPIIYTNVSILSPFTNSGNEYTTHHQKDKENKAPGECQRLANQNILDIFDALKMEWIAQYLTRHLNNKSDQSNSLDINVFMFNYLNPTIADQFLPKNDPNNNGKMCQERAKAIEFLKNTLKNYIFKLSYENDKLELKIVKKTATSAETIFHNVSKKILLDNIEIPKDGLNIQFKIHSATYPINGFRTLLPSSYKKQIAKEQANHLRILIEVAKKQKYISTELKIPNTEYLSSSQLQKIKQSASNELKKLISSQDKDRKSKSSLNKQDLFLKALIEYCDTLAQPVPRKDLANRNLFLACYLRLMCTALGLPNLHNCKSSADRAGYVSAYFNSMLIEFRRTGNLPKYRQHNNSALNARATPQLLSEKSSSSNSSSTNLETKQLIDDNEVKSRTHNAKVHYSKILLTCLLLIERNTNHCVPGRGVKRRNSPLSSFSNTNKVLCCIGAVVLLPVIVLALSYCTVKSSIKGQKSDAKDTGKLLAYAITGILLIALMIYRCFMSTADMAIPDTYSNESGHNKHVRSGKIKTSSKEIQGKFPNEAEAGDATSLSQLCLVSSKKSSGSSQLVNETVVINTTSLKS